MQNLALVSQRIGVQQRRSNMGNFQRSEPRSDEFATIDWHSSPNAEWREDCSWALDLICISLRLVGLWPSEKNSSISYFLRRCRIIIMAALLTFMYTLPETYAIYLVKSEPKLVINGISMIPTMIISVLTLFILSRNTEEIREIFQQIVNDWLMKKTPWERNVMRKQAGRARIFMISGYILIMFTSVYYTVPPYLGVALRPLNNITDSGMDRGRFLPMQASFPFDVFNSPTFEVIYFLTFLAAVSDCLAALLPVILFATIVFHASGQYELLGANMQHIFDNIEGYQAGDKRIFQVKLKRIVDNQTRLHRYRCTGLYGLRLINQN
ncbi:hypothetical protein QAD02_000222 [Eretmocerus hayati]|uniref:Uncharacterized protein n=1 Tax=Eretmocerus hayati TaxID=131215 RepID=A0ACC2NCY9_9HYME|nr:hypothetical protein QAD02_000222 [Eretmocerus hayati]